LRRLEVLEKNFILLGRIGGDSHEEVSCEAVELVEIALSSEGGGAASRIWLADNGLWVVRAGYFRTVLLTFGLGITGAACISFFIRLTCAVGVVRSCGAWERENLTTPKAVRTIKWTPIEAVHAQNVTRFFRKA